ncbi:MAG: RNA polymerase sigma factor [Chthoniobacteraceae bacterium]
MSLAATAQGQLTGSPVETQATPTPAAALTPVGARSIPELTSALRRGDEAAFRWLHAEWNARLSRYGYALASGDEALAGEIVQATYLRVLRHMRELPDEEALWAWLVCAARSASVDLRRRNSRYLHALARFADWLGTKRSQPQSDLEAGLVVALQTAIENLPAEERSLIDARYADRDSLAEIGKRCGLTPRAVEGRMARLRERLRREIATHLKATGTNL